jgi:hypothetical protein
MIIASHVSESELGTLGEGCQQRTLHLETLLGSTSDVSKICPSGDSCEAGTLFREPLDSSAMMCGKGLLTFS